MHTVKRAQDEAGNTGNRFMELSHFLPFIVHVTKHGTLPDGWLTLVLFQSLSNRSGQLGNRRIIYIYILYDLYVPLNEPTGLTHSIHVRWCKLRFPPGSNFGRRPWGAVE